MDIKKTNILHILLLTIVIVPPLLMRALIYEFVSPALEPTVIKTAIYVDVFNQIKFQWLLALSILLIFIFLIFLYFNKIDITFYDYLIGSFLILALGVSYLSKYKYISLWGKYNRTDGAIFFILLFFLFFISSKLSYNDKLMDIFAWALWPFLIFNSILAWMYQNGHNFLETSLFKKMVYPDADYEVSGFIVSTFGNPNYLSGFAGFLAIFYLTRLFFMNKTNISDGFAFIFSLYLVLSSFSSSGLVAFMISFLILFSFTNKENPGPLLKMLLILPFIFFFMRYFIRKDPQIAEEFRILFTIVQKYFLIIFLLLLLMFLIFCFFKKYTKHQGWKVFLNISIVILIFVFFLFVPYSEYYQKDYPHQEYSSQEIISFAENKEVRIDGLSGRIFVWKETLDLIKEKPLLGYGYGTLAYELNQYSIFDSISLWPSDINDKPHNAYFEIAYGGGIFSLAVFMLIFANIFYQALESFRKEIDARNLAIFMGMLAFLIQALINDSNVGFYPVLFIFFGILISRLNNGDIN